MDGVPWRVCVKDINRHNRRRDHRKTSSKYPDIYSCPQNPLFVKGLGEKTRVLKDTQSDMQSSQIRRSHDIPPKLFSTSFRSPNRRIKF